MKILRTLANWIRGKRRGSIPGIEASMACDFGVLEEYIEKTRAVLRQSSPRSNSGTASK